MYNGNNHYELDGGILMRFKTKRDLRVTILYAIVTLTAFILLGSLIKGIVDDFGTRDLFLDIIGIIFTVFIAFMALSVYFINYFEFDLDNKDICSKSGFGYKEKYKFKHVLSCERKRKYLVTSALSVNVLELIVERDKKEGKIKMYASPVDEQGFIKALKDNCRNIKFIEKKETQSKKRK